jgi:hypothetical protein
MKHIAFGPNPSIIGHVKANSLGLAVLLSSALALGVSNECRSQSFQNLDFEDADPSGASWNSGSGCFWLSTASGLPKWHTYWGGEQTTVVYSSVFMDANTVGLYDSTAVAVWGGYQFGPQHALAGTFSAYLHAEGPYSGFQFDASIGQTGLIPAEAKSVQFISSPGAIFNYQPGLPSGMWALSVELNGVSTPCYRLSEQSEYIQWGADVTGVAGTLTELRLTLTTGLVPLPRPGPPDTEGVIIGIDDISFSPIVVPEPSALCLVALGAALLAVLEGSRKG